MHEIMHTSGSHFPTTRLSLVATARAEDPILRREAYDALLRSYWKPAYKYLRLRWRMDREPAEDAVQGFFAKAYETGFLEPFDPAKARFRTWLRLCLDRFVSNQKKAETREKRGGGEPAVPLDFLTAEREVQAWNGSQALDPESFFHREWVRTLFEETVVELRRRCEQTGKQTHFAVFERYDLHDGDTPRPTYTELAAGLGLPPTQVTNYLAWARREFRGLVLEKLRLSTGSESEFRAEARAILGADPL